MQKLFACSGLLSGLQHSFVSGRSTRTNLLSCDAAIADWFNSKTTVNIILLNFARAFDKIQHHLLLDKLALLRVTKQPIQWIENFLMSRIQQIICCNAQSSVTLVTSGVIQSLFLGPCLFLAFTNDLHEKIKTCKLFLFADDSKMASSVKSMADCLLTLADVDAIHIWPVENQLPLSLP